MKTKVLSIFLTLLLASIFSSSNAFAQGAPQWHLPEGAIARLGNGIIHQIAYSPDGSQIAVASSIGIWLYDVDTGIAVTLLEGSNVACIAYSPDGKTIAGCGSFPERRPWGETIMLDTVRLWNVEDGTIQQTLPHTTAGYVDLAWSPDGKTIAVSAAFDPVRLWNIEEGVFKIEFPADTEGVRSIAYHPSGSTIATMNSRDDSVDLYLWDTEKGIYIKTFAENVVGISSMAYSPDGKTIVTGSWNDVHIWDANTGEEKKSGLTTDWGGKQVKCSTVPMVLLSLLSVVHGYISGIPARIPKKKPVARYLTLDLESLVSLIVRMAKLSLPRLRISPCVSGMLPQSPLVL